MRGEERERTSNKPAPDDITGQRFGRLVVREYTGDKATNYDKLYLCQCDCGNTKVVRRSLLVHGQTKSCGCLHSKKKGPKTKYRESLLGQKFGRLTIIEVLGKSNFNCLKVKCKCDCGNITTVLTQDLYSGNIQSCGCLRNKDITKAQEEIKQYYVEGTSLLHLTDKPTSRNKSGIRGVFWDKRRQVWAANITIKRKTIFLGYFPKLEDAAKSRKNAEDKYFKPILDTYKKGGL